MFSSSGTLRYLVLGALESSWAIRDQAYRTVVTDNLRNVQALIVVDMQTAFVSGNEAVPAAAGLLAVVTDLMQRARDAGALVVQLQNDGLPGTVDEPHTPGPSTATAEAPRTVLGPFRYADDRANRDQSGSRAYQKGPKLKAPS